MPHHPNGCWTGARQLETSRLVSRQGPPEQSRSAACGHVRIGSDLPPREVLRAGSRRNLAAVHSSRLLNSLLGIHYAARRGVSCSMESHCVLFRAVRAGGRARMPLIGPKASPSAAAESGGSRVARCQGTTGVEQCSPYAQDGARDPLSRLLAIASASTRYAA
jgi:hypothetical protein